MRKQKRVLVTDTTMRDAHQSLIATRMRTRDIVAVADAYAQGPAAAALARMLGRRDLRRRDAIPERGPVGAAGAAARARCRTSVRRCCCAARTRVGYTNYPDNVVAIVRRAGGRQGIDLFRIFDSLNWVENMRVGDRRRAARPASSAEGAICYTGDILDPDRAKYSLNYYVGVAKELERPGCHILAIKDMAGPAAARRRARRSSRRCARRSACRCTSTRTTPAGICGGDRARRHRCRRRRGRRSDRLDVRHDLAALPRLHRRRRCATPRAIPASTPRPSDRTQLLLGGRARRNTPPSKATSRPARRRSICTKCRAASSPTCASRRAALGLETRWHEVAKAYRAVNDLFGDIVKVTPSSKVVGDMALMMVSQNLTRGRRARSRPRDRLPDLGRRDARAAISGSRRAAGPRPCRRRR